MNRSSTWILCLAVFWSLSCFASRGQTVQSDPFLAELSRLVDKEYPSLEKLYRHLHAHPELSLQEKETSARMAEELKTAGFAVTERVGGYGVVGVMKNGDGPVVLIRTDTDALPVKEETGLPFASQVLVKDDQGREVSVAHACGHDVHMTIFTGTARLLFFLKKNWKGTVVMIAQPAEERGAGARAMIADGLFNRFPRPDYALALHVDSSLEAGKIGYTSGYALANVDTVEITIRGIGGHGAYPETTKDPIVISAQVILALQTIISRENRPYDPAVITVGSIHGGTKSNIIPSEVKMQLTVRTYSDQVRNRLLAAIERTAKGIALAAGVPPELEPIVETKREEYTPATYNDPELVKRVTATLGRLLGADNVVTREAMMGGEDFGRYGREEPKIPIFMFRLGSVSPERIQESRRDGGKPLPSLHSGLYFPQAEPTIKTGIKAMTSAVLDLLK